MIKLFTSTFIVFGLVLFSGCGVKEIPKHLIKTPPPQVDSQTARGPVVPAAETSALSQLVPTVTQDGLNPTVIAAVDDVNGPQQLEDSSAETQAIEPLQPCEGIRSGITIAPQVQKFLTCEIIAILSQPDKVESFRVKAIKADASIPVKNQLGHYEINEQGQDLTGKNLDLFQALVFSEKSYIFDMEKRCRFYPNVGLYFIKDDKSVAVLFATSCSLWQFVYGDDEKLEDFDPVHEQLTLVNHLFPVKTEGSVETPNTSHEEAQEEVQPTKVQEEPSVNN